MDRTGRVYCIQLTVGFAERWVKDHPGKSCLMKKTGEHLTDEEHLAFVAKLKAEGFEMVPCDHADELGFCQGELKS